MQTLPWTLDSDQMVLGVGVYAGENWNAGERLPVTAHTAELPVLNGGTLLRLGGFVRNNAGGWASVAADDAPIGRQTPLNIGFGDAIELVGASTPATAQAGAPLTFSLYWQATQKVTQDYNSFVHLLDATGEKVAQLDWTPGDAIGHACVNDSLMTYTKLGAFQDFAHKFGAHLVAMV